MKVTYYTKPRKVEALRLNLARDFVIKAVDIIKMVPGYEVKEHWTSGTWDCFIIVKNQFGIEEKLEFGINTWLVVKEGDVLVVQHEDFVKNYFFVTETVTKHTPPIEELLS